MRFGIRFTVLLHSTLLFVAIATIRTFAQSGAVPANSPVVVDVAQYLSASTSAAYITKITIDAIKKGKQIGPGLTLLLVFLLAQSLQLLLLTAQRQSLDIANLSASVLVGFAAFAGAVASTELQKSRTEDPPKS